MRTRPRLPLAAAAIAAGIVTIATVRAQPPAPTPDPFTSESIENIPAGWRARETYILHGPDEFEEIFELAQAGKPFEVYSRSRLNAGQNESSGDVSARACRDPLA